MVEQKGLCAYTGRRINDATCHIEHPVPQAHCGRGQDVSYLNMLACVPAPHQPALPYGAHKKGMWPDATQKSDFVSPLSSGCGTRFSFNLRGEIVPRDRGDKSAAETIRRLGLNHPLLIQLRKAAIEGTLGMSGNQPVVLDLKNARKRIAGLKAAESKGCLLEAFSFVLQQALERHIDRLQAIRASLSA